MSSSGQNSPNYRTTTATFDGKSLEASNRSLDHLLSKHGHTFGTNQNDNGYEDSKIS